VGRLSEDAVVRLVAETNHAEAWARLGKLGWRDRRRFRLLLKLIAVQDSRAVQWALQEIRATLERGQL
jgi:hypothetical protein